MTDHLRELVESGDDIDLYELNPFRIDEDNEVHVARPGQAVPKAR